MNNLKAAADDAWAQVQARPEYPAFIGVRNAADSIWEVIQATPEYATYVAAAVAVGDAR